MCGLGLETSPPSSWRQLATTASSHSSTSVWQRSSISVRLCSNRRTTWEKGPGGHATAALPKPYVTHSSKIDAVSMFLVIVAFACGRCMCTFFTGFLSRHMLSTVYSQSLTSLYFHPAQMSPNVRDASACDWLYTGASATHTPSAQLRLMHGQT